MGHCNRLVIVCSPRPMSRAYFSLFTLAICIALSGCRGLVSTGPANQIQVTLNQYFVRLAINTNSQFTATVTGTTNTNVTWSVDRIVGGNSTVGTIAAAALYSAPPQAGTHTVT